MSGEGFSRPGVRAQDQCEKLTVPGADFIFPSSQLSLGQDPLMLSILREDILPVTRRKGAGNRPVFKTFQHCHGQNRPRPSGLKENTRLKSKNARKGKKPCLALFQHHSNVFFQTELHKINES
jgi:hypothetical protein